MIDRLNAAPLNFWLHLIVLGFLVIEGLRQWNAPWAKPALVIYGTVAFWYTGDFLLSTAINYQAFTQEVISLAFLQVTGFLVTFRLLLVLFARRFCEEPLRARRRQALAGNRAARGEISPLVLRNLLILLIFAWAAIFAVGASLSPEVWPALIWPPLHHEKIGMYPITEVGGGYSFLFNALSYLHVLICALFGVIGVIARGPVRWVAVAMALLSWPYFWFDRARNRMLALLLPGLAAYLLVGKRSLALRFAVVGISSLILVAWFTRVMEYRSDNHDLAAFLEENTAESEEDEVLRRQAARIGQDMLKELCWINTFIPSGRYRPNWGGRYFAELVNPIPRTLWPGKPMVGIDYALARGFGGSRAGHGVYATIATGMIGQGCVNFGRFLGPPAAALLFALWAAFLARLWCQRAAPLRLALFLIGLGLTLNTGRDLTFLVLFPFAFGFVALKVYERFRRPTRQWRPAHPTHPLPSQSAALSERTSDLPLDP